MFKDLEKNGKLSAKRRGFEEYHSDDDDDEEEEEGWKSNTCLDEEEEEGWKSYTCLADRNRMQTRGIDSSGDLTLQPIKGIFQ